jgi:uncharacterized protein (DUF1697 family)
MTTFVALFRGINVGGKNSLPMKELVAVLESLGAKNIKTYIQSGNAIFQSSEKNISRFSNKVCKEIESRFGFSLHVVIFELAEIEKVIANNPFKEAEGIPDTLHLGFLAMAPVNSDLSKLDSIKKSSERFYLMDKIFYLHAPEGFGRSKLAVNSEKLIGVPMTFRNWRTLSKIRELAIK